MLKLSVIIPFFNEERTIREIVRKSMFSLFELEHEKIIDFFEIILIDDGSTDNSKKIVRREFSSNDVIKIVTLKNNCGKGKAIIEGLKYISGNFVLIQDADLEYDPKDYGTLLKPVILNNADVVFGSRFSSNYQGFFLNRLANKALTIFSNFLTGFKLTDMETGYKLIRTTIFKNLLLVSKDFGIEPEITAKLAKYKNLKFFEVPVSYRPRGYSEGKKIGLRDGLLAIKYIVFFNLFSGYEDSFYQVLKNEAS